MCGLAVVFDGQQDVLDRMLKQMDYRGLRSSSKDVGDRVILGHVRLPIQDLSEESDQPMHLGGDQVGVFVGEVFNFREWDEDAATDFPIFERLLTNGELELADGFWAAVLKYPNGQTVAVTDPLGKKQLYYRRDVPAICSEITPLTLLGPVTPDDLYYSMVAKWGYCIYDRTPFNEIAKIPAGTAWLFDESGKVVHTKKVGWGRPCGSKNVSLRHDLLTAVGNRTVADVPLSVLVSGGLDSTIIYSLLLQYEIPFTAYHIANDEEEFLQYLKVPDYVTLKRLDINFDEFDLDDVILSNDSPVDLGSMIPQYLLSRAIRSDGTFIALSGDGADELFGGYHRAATYDSQWSDVFCELPFYHLPRLDRLMMRHTVELRCPFLSLPVVEKALCLPWEKRTEKQYLKETFRDLVPEPILNRPKKALKSKPLLQDPLAWRIALINRHREMFWDGRTIERRAGL